MLQLYSARDSMDAHFLQGLLAEEGIEAVIQGEALEEVWGDLPLSQRTVPTLWINESDLARANPIVEEYERRRLNNVENGAAPARPGNARAAASRSRNNSPPAGIATPCAREQIRARMMPPPSEFRRFPGPPSSSSALPA